MSPRGDERTPTSALSHLDPRNGITFVIVNSCRLQIYTWFYFGNTKLHAEFFEFYAV